MPPKSPTLTSESASTSRASPYSSSKNSYLIAYNFISFLLWTILTLRLVVLLPFLYPDRIYGIYDHLFHPLLTFAQSLAILEILHAAFGVVRASPLTTAMQVASRYLVVWFVVGAFPEIIMGREIVGIRTKPVGKVGEWAFVGCLAAWGPTEMIKYGYFVSQLALGGAPEWLNWLRYNTFFVLYPIGISSEVWLVWLATKPAGMVSPYYQWFLYGSLAVYVPGSYILYTHMMSQRRRVMKGKSKSG